MICIIMVNIIVKPSTDVANNTIYCGYLKKTKKNTTMILRPDVKGALDRSDLDLSNELLIPGIESVGDS